jgi:hypothetical protein
MRHCARGQPGETDPVDFGLEASEHPRMSSTNDPHTEQRPPVDPSGASILNLVEPWLFLVLALVMTPALSRLIVRMLSGPNPGELGFGGVVFVMGGFLLAVVMAISALVILRFYLRDAHRLRWSINLGAFVIALWVLGA